MTDSVRGDSGHGRPGPRSVRSARQMHGKAEQQRGKPPCRSAVRGQNAPLAHTPAGRAGYLMTFNFAVARFEIASPRRVALRETLTLSLPLLRATKVPDSWGGVRVVPL